MHLVFTFPAIVGAGEDIEEINKALTHHTFHGRQTYAQLLFTTWPGMTGVILVICIVLMSVLSINPIRRNCYQVFSYTHMICFPIFLICIILHGAGSWLNFGYPTGIYFIPLPFIIYLIMIF
jgi:hypothetical protein